MLTIITSNLDHLPLTKSHQQISVSLIYLLYYKIISKSRKVKYQYKTPYDDDLSCNHLTAWGHRLLWAYEPIHNSTWPDWNSINFFVLAGTKSSSVPTIFNNGTVIFLRSIAVFVLVFLFYLFLHYFYFDPILFHS